MAFNGRLHPLLIHFPIALVLAAVAAEIAAIHRRAEQPVESRLLWRVESAADGHRSH